MYLEIIEYALGNVKEFLFVWVLMTNNIPFNPIEEINHIQYTYIQKENHAIDSVKVIEILRRC